MILIITATTVFNSCENNSATASLNQTTIDSLRNQIKDHTAGKEMIAKNLITFDTLDYTVFSNQEWTRLDETHAENIKVN